MSSQSFMNMNSMKVAISAIDTTERPNFMSPKPKSPNKVAPAVAVTKAPQTLETILGKRKYKDAFDEASFDDARYEQHIAIDFFETNIGHNVIQKQNSLIFQEAVDSVIKDFRQEISFTIPTAERRERDGESKYDPEELKTWCEYYIANRNLFNV